MHPVQKDRVLEYIDIGRAEGCDVFQVYPPSCPALPCPSILANGLPGWLAG